VQAVERIVERLPVMTRAFWAFRAFYQSHLSTQRAQRRQTGATRIWSMYYLALGVQCANQASRRQKSNPLTASAPTVQVASTPRPAHGLSGRKRRLVVAVIVSPAVIGPICWR
jgi:hypothetical protein